MNYFHSYHAGNSADVFKHATLVQLIQYLLKKPQGFCYIDTHAGLPHYDFTQPEPQATGEYKQGIGLLWDKTPLPSELTDYLSLLSTVNDNALRFYLGSSGFAQALLRPVDRAILCDIQPEVHQALKQYYRTHSNIQVHKQDGYQALNAFVPPKEKRGLVLIDPPYEQPEDWHRLSQTIQQAYRKWPTGIYTLWFPIKDTHLVKQLIEEFANSGIPNILLSEFCPWPTDVPQRLNGSGLIIVNPPWQLDIGLRKFLPTLLEHLRQHPQGYTRTYWLTNPI